MSFAALARGCATRGVRRLPTVSGGGVATLRNNNTLQAARTTTQRRSMGGGQPISRSMEAELFEGHPKEPEGWETTVYLTYGATVVLLTMALGFAPDTSIKTVSYMFTYYHLYGLTFYYYYA